jgi:RNA polymerase sigma-70 factor (ECF subfamily)
MSNGNDWLAQRFEAHRGHLRRVAYRMLGSLGEAEDAVQEAWLRLSRSEANDIDNLGGWLTTVVSRVCLDMLRSRKTRGEESLDENPAESAAAVRLAANPERSAARRFGGARAARGPRDARAGRAESLSCCDMFDLPFEEIAAIVPAVRRPRRGSRAARGGASAARGHPTRPGSGQREVVARSSRRCVRATSKAWWRSSIPTWCSASTRLAARAHPSKSAARNWAKGAIAYAQAARFMRPALVNGAVGLILAPRGRLQRVLAFEFDAEARIRAAEIISDPARLGTLDLAALP